MDEKETGQETAFEKYWKLNEVFNLITIKSNEATWPCPVELRDGQDYYFTLTDKPDGKSRRLILHVWVCKKDNMVHVYEGQSIHFKGVVSPNGEMRPILATSRQENSSFESLGPKLTVSQADNILDLAFKIKDLSQKKTKNQPQS